MLFSFYSGQTHVVVEHHSIVGCAKTRRGIPTRNCSEAYFRTVLTAQARTWSAQVSYFATGLEANSPLVMSFNIDGFA